MNVTELNLSKSLNGEELQILSFDETIVIDYRSLPFDDTEGHEMRDIQLSDALYGSDFQDIDDTLELADVLQVQGV